LSCHEIGGYRLARVIKAKLQLNTAITVARIVTKELKVVAIVAVRIPGCPF